MCTVEKAGQYIIELSRWPFHLERSLTAEGPTKAVGGTPIRKGVSLPIDAGCFSVNGKAPLVAKKGNEEAHLVSFTTVLEKGEQTFRGWFRDAAGKDVCGAYYMRVKRVP